MNYQVFMRSYTLLKVFEQCFIQFTHLRSAGLETVQLLKGHGKEVNNHWT